MLPSLRPLVVQLRSRASLERLARRITRKLGRPRTDAAATDLAIAAVIARQNPAPLADPAGHVRFLRDCFGRLRLGVTEVNPAEPAGDVASLRFETLVQALRSGVPPIPEYDAVRIGRLADDLLSRTDPFERQDWVADVGTHAAIASSFGREGRLLAAIVRIMRVERAIEIGTAYGMSALFLAAAMGGRGALVTAERSDPQAGIAAELLEREHPGTVTVLRGISTSLVAQVRDRLGSAELLFHDGEHSRRAYVEDFAKFEPLLGPGAVVLYDDIDWRVGRDAAGADTYAGWRDVAAHERVRRAVEVDREFGLLLLR